jgi:hypothetical protein
MAAGDALGAQFTPPRRLSDEALAEQAARVRANNAKSTMPKAQRAELRREARREQNREWHE